MDKKLLNCSAVINEYGKGDARARIITSGRLLMAEAAKRRLNGRNDKSVYALSLNNDKYSALEHNHKKALFSFAQKVANSFLGKETDSDVSITREMAYNDTFIKVCQDIMADIITPMMPIVTNDMLGIFAETHEIELGQTKQITINSNAIFTYEDSADGVHSAVNQYLYKDTVTLNPHRVSARSKVNWFEYFSNGGDLGELYNALALGWYAYVTGRFAKTFNTAINSTDYTPSPLIANSYSTVNFAKVVANVKRANGGGRIAAFGDILAMSGIGPEKDSNDMYRAALGDEWAHIGYLTSYKGADLYAIDNAIIPDTVNTSLTPVFSESTVWVTVINGLKPIHIGLGKQRMQLTLTPDKTADDSMVIENNLYADVQIAMGSKIGAILNVG